MHLHRSSPPKPPAGRRPKRDSPELPNVDRHAQEASYPQQQPPSYPQQQPPSPFSRAPPLHPFGDADAFGEAFGDHFTGGSAGDERLLEEVELRAASANFPRRHALALIRHDSDPAALPGRSSIRSFSAGAAET
jgi:hypothetical protein